MVPIFDLELDDTPFMRPILIYAENFKKKIMEYEVLRTTLEDKKTGRDINTGGCEEGGSITRRIGCTAYGRRDGRSLCRNRTTGRRRQCNRVIFCMCAGSDRGYDVGTDREAEDPESDPCRWTGRITVTDTFLKRIKKAINYRVGNSSEWKLHRLRKKRPEGAQDYYQYCTAIPIATTLAQSWDVDLIKRMGEIVGEEMEQFHIHLWLAPGMNIHRNPLCGRNFEYYSEDPLLTGLCAAADTKGVQSYKGHGTTIKHFAGNNQEDNRMFTNAHISERALREIYLKGFGIAVKTAQPYAIMTSYNLINGTHAANHYDMLQNVARDEWGI